ncbi:hypothetical protein [Murinocardiopsis flavida]|uniref:hypothetical protein n=1 Tax=Murinocardiopsis flavida TaxID=645275 RepID=UPI000D0D1AAF|nr:hypothetical protein [Murinocardiopsis flavida]
MRATLTIDEDVATQLGELREREGIGLDHAVNRLLRLGLRLTSPGGPFHTSPVDLGRPQLTNVDSISSVLEYAEGSEFR